jgi:peptidylprolyl isomerase
MNAFRSFVGFVLFLLASLGLAQATFSPAKGETLLKLEIESRGNLFIRLFTKEAPRATAHIMDLTQKGFYDGKPFHRVERSPKPFLAQFGPTNSTEAGDVRIPFEDTGKSFNEAGMVGLSAKPNDRDSGDSQFHILLGPATFLDGSYTCFGKVVFGNEILAALKQGDRVKKASIIRG